MPAERSAELGRLKHGYLSSPEEIIDEARNGRMFILVDDEDRENEGDLVIPAQMATPEKINFMAKFGRGLICLALTKTRTEELGLELMSRNNGTRHETAFTVSIEALEGVTTGISAADRARTIAVAIDATKQKAVEFGLNIIPHTWGVTTLGTIETDRTVNIEIDVLARYLQRMEHYRVNAG